MNRALEVQLTLESMEKASNLKFFSLMCHTISVINLHQIAPNSFFASDIEVCLRWTRWLSNSGHPGMKQVEERLQGIGFRVLVFEPKNWDNSWPEEHRYSVQVQASNTHDSAFWTI